MSEFDKIILGESKNLYKLYSPMLKARFKTEDAAIKGVSAAIREVLARYEGQEQSPALKTQIQGDIERLLVSMVSN